MNNRRPSLIGRAAGLLLGVGLVLGIGTALDVKEARAHNLQTKMVYMFFDPGTQQMLDERIAGNDPSYPDYAPPEPLLKVGDELGMIIKVIPRDGTSTGVGGHVDFYVPNGVQVIDAAYILPGDSDTSDGLVGYDKVPMKGQSLIAIGDGPVGAKTTAELAGLSGTYTNVLGNTQDPVDASGTHLGTVSGVYGDTGIFYATDPDTAFGSWQVYTGNSADDLCGTDGVNLDIGGTANFITNNSGDTFVPCNKWDAEQMFAWGVKGTDCTLTGCVGSPIVDYGDGRGNAPWGFAAGTGGPESGYAWNFDWDEYVSLGADPATDMQAAMSPDDVGPWKRIQYPGSRITQDDPGLVSTDLGISSIDAGDLGYDLSPANPLPATVDQADAGSPKAIRWAVGQLTDEVPEYVWVKFKVLDTAAILNPDGCPVFHSDTFGGDAGGTDNGKDHLWRYYEPTRISWDACVALGKPADPIAIAPGQTYTYKIKVYNAGGDGTTQTNLTNVTVIDTLPSGVDFVSADPAPNAGPDPLVWTVPSILQGDLFEAEVTVTANGSGLLENQLCVSSDQRPDVCAQDQTPSGSVPILKQSKVASSASVAPGDPVTYTITIDNIGTGPSGSPIEIVERFESPFTYASLGSVTLNGASVTATVDSSNSQEPVFTVAGAINGGESLLLSFTANSNPNAEPGTYCNSYTSFAGGTPLSTGSQACVNLGGAKVGGTIFRDWLGDGTQDVPGDEGAPGVTVTLLDCGADLTCGNADDGATKTTTTDANGDYLFEGLAPDEVTGTRYEIAVSDGSGSRSKATAKPPTPPAPAVAAAPTPSRSCWPTTAKASTTTSATSLSAPEPSAT